MSVYACSCRINNQLGQKKGLFIFDFDGIQENKRMNESTNRVGSSIIKMFTMHITIQSIYIYIYEQRKKIKMILIHTYIYVRNINK